MLELKFNDVVIINNNTVHG